MLRLPAAPLLLLLRRRRRRPTSPEEAAWPQPKARLRLRAGERPAAGSLPLTSMDILKKVTAGNLATTAAIMSWGTTAAAAGASSALPCATPALQALQAARQ